MDEQARERETCELPAFSYLTINNFFFDFFLPAFSFLFFSFSIFFAALQLFHYFFLNTFNKGENEQWQHEL